MDDIINLEGVESDIIKLDKKISDISGQPCIFFMVNGLWIMIESVDDLNKMKRVSFIRKTLLRMEELKRENMRLEKIVDTLRNRYDFIEDLIKDID